MEHFDGEESTLNTGDTDLRKYFWLLWQWAWLIGLATLLAAGAAFIVSELQTPVYQASTTILVNEAPSTQSSNYSAIYLTSQQLTKTYAEMLTKKPLLDKVRQNLGLSENVEFDVKVNFIRDTQLVQLLVEHTDPFLAANVANEMVKVFSDDIRNLQQSKYAASKENLKAQLDYLDQQIVENQNALDAIIQNNLKQLQSSGENVEIQPTAALLERARMLSAAEIDRLETRISQYRQLYASILSSYEQIRLAEAQTTTSFIQVEPATPPEKPIRPRTLLNTALAAVVGLMLAIGGVFAIDFLDDTLHDPEVITTLSGLPILASISEHEVEDSGPVTQAYPRSPVSEAFRALRTNVQYSSVDRPLRRIIVTSPTPEDGKTTVVANLAVVLAQGGINTLLLDADLRRPRLHKMFKFENKFGLSSLFVQPIDLLEKAIMHSQRTEGLHLITSGGTPPNPAELLGSQKMREILNRLSQSFDTLLLDTPPILTVTDTVALSKAVDGILIVVRLGKTKRGEFLQAIEHLRQVNANLVGVVINGVSPRHARYHYYYRNYYYYQYNAYYGEGEKRKTSSNGSRSNGKHAPVSHRAGESAPGDPL